MGCGLAACTKGVVPVVVRGAETLDGRMPCDHGLGHEIPGEVSVEAAVDGQAGQDESREPCGVGPSAAGGDAEVMGMKSQTADGVDGRLTEDDGGVWLVSDSEVAEVLAGSWCHATP